MLEERKIVEAEFHDLLRDPALKENPELYAKLTSNRKWYCVTRKSWAFFRNYLWTHSRDAVALDFACGDGICAFEMAEAGASVFGIDISETSVGLACQQAAMRGLSAQFQVMDCENMTFPDSKFDLISVSGVLHHMDLNRAFSELARVLKPNGSVICGEPLAHNPVFQTYRKLTPHLRTEFEANHILRRQDVLKAGKYFNRVDLHFYHLLDLAAVPFKDTRVFDPLLTMLENIDGLLLKVTPLRWWAWQVLFVLSEPRKSTKTQE
jgi:2-polyprenyl-3-methyl-5-hydroxy-6-metoxy-1,4-benzoquinol methylase